MTGTRIAAVILMFGCLAATGACGKDPEAARREYVRSGDRYVAEKKYQEAYGTGTPCSRIRILAKRA